MQEENIAIRLKFLISELGINSSVFAEKCGISRATLSQLLTGRNKKISDVIIAQVHKAYPDLSILWLLFNEGPMWANDKAPVHITENNEAIASIQNKEGYTEQPDNSADRTQNGILNPYENLETPATGQEKGKYSKENGLNCEENIDNDPNLKHVSSCINTVDLFNKIENLRPKPRKVVQITIYFDDSTFESFYPK